MRRLALITILALSGLADVGCMQQKVQRYGMVLGVKKERLEEYKRLHAAVYVVSRNETNVVLN